MSGIITSDCYEQRCFQHDQAVYKCAVNSNYYFLSELLLNANQRAKRMKHKWLERNRDEKYVKVATAYAANGTSIVLDENAGHKEGDIVTVQGSTVSYIVTGVSADGLTLTVDPTDPTLINGTSEAIAVGTKIRRIRPASETGCYDDGCKPEQPEEKFNLVQIFESCPIEVSKYASIEAKNGGYLGIDDIMAEGTEQELENLLDEMNQAVHFGMRREKGTNNEASMGGIFWFINQAITENPDVEICIDASTYEDKDGNAIVPEVGTVINDALESIMGCGGTADVLIVNPTQARAIRQQYKCKDYCNVFYLDTVVGDVPATAFEGDLAGKNGNSFLGILVDPHMPVNQALVGKFDSAQLMPFDECDLELKDVSNPGCKGDKMVLEGAYTLEVKNVKCNWRWLKNLTC